MAKKKILVSILTVLLITAVLVGSFAWFYINESAYVDFGSDIVCEAGKSLEISVDGGLTWSGVIDRTGFGSETVDITGDGLQFYKPLSVDETALPVGFTEASAVNEAGEGEYVEIELMFRSVSKMNVYLSEDSFVLPTDSEREGNIFGDFSRDYIAGAARVAFIHNDLLKMIWAPNPEYELSQDSNGAYSFRTDGVWETYYYTQKSGGEYLQLPYDAEAFATSQFVVGSTGTNVTTQGNSGLLFSLNPAEDEYAVETLTIRIWFEGTDREASAALAGGQIKAKLKFTGIDKATADSSQQQAIDALTYSGGTIVGLQDGMSFSTDGISWTVYTADAPNLPALAKYDAIYFRYDETNTSFKTTVKKVVLS